MGYSARAQYPGPWPLALAFESRMWHKPNTHQNFGATRCAVVPYPGYAHCAYIGTYKLVYGIRYHVHDYVLRRWAAGRPLHPRIRNST